MKALITFQEFWPYGVTITVLLLLYLIGAVYVIGALLYFRKKIKKKIVAFSVVFSEKKEILLSVFKLYESAKLPLQETDRESCSRVRWLSLESVKAKDVMPISSVLSDLERRLTLLSETETYIRKSEELSTLMKTLKDVDASYRRIVNVYNADVSGYSYWRKFAPYRWLSFILGFQKYERIA